MSTETVLSRIAEALELGNKLIAKNIKLNEDFIEIRKEESACMRERDAFYRLRDIINLFTNIGDKQETLLPMMYESLSVWERASENAGYAEKASWNVFVNSYQELINKLQYDVDFSIKNGSADKLIERIKIQDELIRTYNAVKKIEEEKCPKEIEDTCQAADAIDRCIDAAEKLKEEDVTHFVNSGDDIKF